MVLGNYRLSKIMTMNPETEKMEFVDVQVAYDHMKAAGVDPRELLQMEFQMKTTLRVTENELIYTLEIPEEMPAEELERAKKAGMIEDGLMVMEKTKCKLENGELFMYDRSTFLAGSEWVKITTDVPGELNMVMNVWTKVE